MTTGGAVITGGKATKTGMVLARAQLTYKYPQQQRQEPLYPDGDGRSSRNWHRDLNNFSAGGPQVRGKRDASCRRVRIVSATDVAATDHAAARSLADPPL